MDTTNQKSRQGCGRFVPVILRKGVSPITLLINFFVLLHGLRHRIEYHGLLIIEQRVFFKRGVFNL